MDFTLVALCVPKMEIIQANVQKSPFGGKCLTKFYVFFLVSYASSVRQKAARCRNAMKYGEAAGELRQFIPLLEVTG